MAKLYYAVIYTLEDGILEVLKTLDKWELDNIIRDYKNDNGVFVMHGPKSEYNMAAILAHVGSHIRDEKKSEENFDYADFNLL